MGRFRYVLFLVLAAACGASQTTTKTTVDSAPRDAVLIHGEVSDAGIRLMVGAEQVLVPEASLVLRVPEHLKIKAGDIVTIKAPAQSGYTGAMPLWDLQVLLPPPTKVAAWQLTIFEVAADGSPVPFFAQKGDGRPSTLAWAGLGSDGSALKAGALYVAQLIAVGSDRDAAAASRFVPFAVAGSTVAATPAGPSEEILRGALFEGNAPTAHLQEQIRALAKSMVPGTKVEVFVHADGSDKGVSAWAQTQRRALAVRKLLVAAGVAQDHITAKGRGPSQPLAPPDSQANRDKNLRVVVVMTPPKSAPARAVASAPTIDASHIPRTVDDVRIDGREVVLKDGKFEQKRFLSDDGGFFVQVELSDGRLSTIRTHRTLQDGVNAEEGAPGVPPSWKVASTGAH